MADIRYLKSDFKKLEDFKALVDAGLVKTGHADIASFMDNQYTSLESLEAEVDVLDSKQITEDFYHINSDTITLKLNEFTYIYEWTVKAGETMDLEVHFDTDQAGDNNAVWLYLFMDDDITVARSIDDGDGGDDNSVVTLFYRAQV